MGIATTAEVVGNGHRLTRGGTFEPVERTDQSSGARCAVSAAGRGRAESVETPRRPERNGAVEVTERTLGLRDRRGVGESGQRTLGGE